MVCLSTWKNFNESSFLFHPLLIQPENILCLTESGNRIKIIDFGLAREYDPSTKLQVLFGTPEFVAPEVVNFDAITFATDMWSVGVIAYVLWVFFLYLMTRNKKKSHGIMSKNCCWHTSLLKKSISKRTLMENFSHLIEQEWLRLTNVDVIVNI